MMPDCRLVLRTEGRRREWIHSEKKSPPRHRNLSFLLPEVPGKGRGGKGGAETRPLNAKLFPHFILHMMMTTGARLNLATEQASDCRSKEAPRPPAPIVPSARSLIHFPFYTFDCLCDADAMDAAMDEGRGGKGMR